MRGRGGWFGGRFRGLKRRRKVLEVGLRGKSLEIANGDESVMESDGGTIGKVVRRVSEPSGFGTMLRSL